jgi:16S rRNA (cytosine1402-N4)-methyltransferase
LGSFHQAVLVREVLDYLITDPKGTYVDATVGMGGHAEAVGRRLAGKGLLICLDRDPDAVRVSTERLKPLGHRVKVLQANYADLHDVLQTMGVEGINGILLDLGMSSYQLEHSGRGFSFDRDEPLDMRMNPSEGMTAAELVNEAAPGDLERVLREFGEEKRARQIVRAIVRARERDRIETARQLAGLVRSALPPTRGPEARHPATRTFQALRIAVNQELENLHRFLKRLPTLMKKGGRLIVLSYHSLEDRMVKQAMTEWEERCTCPPDLPVCGCGKTQLFSRPFRRPKRPGAKEIEKNRRARSAKLRVAERI